MSHTSSPPLDRPALVVARGLGWGALTGALVGGLVGTRYWPIVGTFLGAIVGTVTGSVLGLFAAFVLALLATLSVVHTEASRLGRARVAASLSSGAGAALLIWRVGVVGAPAVAFVALSTVLGAAFAGPVLLGAARRQPPRTLYEVGSRQLLVARAGPSHTGEKRTFGVLGGIAIGMAAGFAIGAVVGAVIGFRYDPPALVVPAIFEGAILGIAPGLMLGFVGVVVVRVVRIVRQR